MRACECDFDVSDALFDAERNAVTDWDMGFVSDLQDKYAEYGDQMFISDLQAKQLCRIAKIKY